ncbi:MAG: hypothetical protein HKO59_03050 [Phycisphaerales bacterium]|nr:hypothetical protein [Phycisphaerales bacterium]
MRQPSVPYCRRSRGSAYLLVLVMTAMVVVIGLGAIAVARLNHRNAAVRGDEAAADVLALSALEMGITVLEDAMDAAELSASPWRPGFTHGVWSSPVDFGGGTVEWSLADATGDEDLADSDSDPIVLTGRGSINDAVRRCSVLLVPAGAGLEVLQTPLHTAGNLINDKSLAASGGPISVAGSLYNNDTIAGDVEAGAVMVHGSISGTVTTPVPAKDMPGSSIFQSYYDRATPIPWSAFPNPDFEPGLLSAAVNPYGPQNKDGVYRVDVPAFETLKVREGRIRGTLVITLGYKSKLKLQDELLLEPHRPDFPCLIVQGAVDAKVELGWPDGATLDEAAVGVNLNPPHTPFEGDSDGSLDDVYTPEIRGLVHVLHAGTGTFLGDDLDDSELVVTGTILTEGLAAVASKGTATLTVDPALFVNPPEGYSEGDRVAPLPGSWTWTVDP